MKQSKRVLALMIVFITVLALLPVSAFAARSYKTLKYNKWYRLNNSSSKMTIYKLKVPEDSLITVEWKGNNKNNPIYGVICTDKQCNHDIDSFLGNLSKSKGKSYTVLYKGTYYIEMLEDSASKKTTQIRITKQSVKSINGNKKNTSSKRAITLKPYQTTELILTKNDYRERWYKIELTKKQKLTFCYYESYPDFRIYDDKFHEIDFGGWGGSSTYGGRGYVKQSLPKKIDKGIYYIVFYTGEYGIEEMKETGRYCKLFWE